MVRPPCEGFVGARHLGRVHDLLEAFGVVVDAVGEREPHLRETGVILFLLEQRQRREAEFLRLVDRSLSEQEPHLCSKPTGERSAGRVGSVVSSSRCLLEQALRVTCGDVAHRKRDFQVDIGPLDELHGTS